MDAEYLQKNIMAPLSEAVASMAVRTPDDEVFILFVTILYVKIKIGGIYC